MNHDKKMSSMHKCTRKKWLAFDPVVFLAGLTAGWSYRRYCIATLHFLHLEYTQTCFYRAIFLLQVQYVFLLHRGMAHCYIPKAINMLQSAAYWLKL